MNGPHPLHHERAEGTGSAVGKPNRTVAVAAAAVQAGNVTVVRGFLTLHGSYLILDLFYTIRVGHDK